MRIRNNPKAKPILLKSPFLIKDFPFKVNSKTVVELGMGKGEMLVKLAQKNPDKLYIGVEKYATIAGLALKLINKYNIKNLLIINEDIKHLNILLNGFVDEMWLTFPDPWPKCRHEKRRLTNKFFLDIYRNILSPIGVLKFKTDNDKLFQYSLNSMKESKFKISNVSNDFHSEAFSKNNFMTGYEKKWSQKGKKINYLEARK